MPQPIAPDAPPEARANRVRVDVRDAAAFAGGHLAGSGHIPAAELRERRAELPPRETPLLVIADDGARARESAATIEALGYTDVAWLDATPERCGEPLAHDAPERLWRPSPFLERVLPEIPRGRALDVAAGHGRDAVFLALHGFDVEAWDRAPEALAAAAALAGRHGVRITTHVVDLERRSVTLPVACYQLVTVFRFLHRPLLRHLEQALAPGGRLVYETFRMGQERYGRPRSPRYLFQDGELARAFPSLVVERYEETNPDGGPVLARLLARRP
jgi:rhodanese-related sulfurtransferase